MSIGNSNDINIVLELTSQFWHVGNLLNSGLKKREKTL